MVENRSEEAFLAPTTRHEANLSSHGTQSSLHRVQIPTIPEPRRISEHRHDSIDAFHSVFLVFRYASGVGIRSLRPRGTTRFDFDSSYRITARSPFFAATATRDSLVAA